MRHPLLRWGAALSSVVLVLLSALGARADEVKLMDGRTFSDCVVEGFAMEAGQPLFAVKVPNASGGMDGPFKLPAAQIQGILFIGSGGAGRKAAFTATTGSFPEVKVMNGQGGPTGFQFGMYNKTTADAQFYNVPVTAVQKIDFSADDIGTSASLGAAVAARASHSGSSSSEVSASSSGSDTESGSDSSSYKSHKSSSSDDNGDDESDSSSSYSSHKYGDGPSKSSMLWFLGLGIGALLGILAIAFFINVLINSVIIMGVARYLANVTELKYKQCFMCSLFLGLIPILCIILLILPIPFFFTKLWLCVLLLIFGSRAVVMGTLDVMEGTAWTVILGFVASTFMLNKIIAIVMGG